MLELDTPIAAAAWLRKRVAGSLQTDSRKVRTGDGFVAWPGATVDARLHVRAAINQGATACLVECSNVEQFEFFDPVVAGYRGLKSVCGSIASNYFENPSAKLEVVAITGTNGKTSTAWWLAQSLSMLTLVPSRLCGFIGTLGIGYPKIGLANGISTIELSSSGLTTPDPIRLQHSLREFVEAGVTVCAMEASSIGIEEGRLSGTHISIAVFTNFSLDHLDYHGSMSAYWQAKATLFNWPGLRAAVVNIDDEKGAELAKVLSSAKSNRIDIWTLSCAGPARLQAQEISFGTVGLNFVVVEGDVRLPVHTVMLGQYNINNLLGVIGAMRALGVPLKACVASCESLKPAPGRMECQGGEGQPLVAVDYAHTPDALHQALVASRQIARFRGGVVWCVFGCGGDRDRSKRPLMGAVAANNADHVVVTSDNPRSESPRNIIDQILVGVAECPTVHVQEDRALAIKLALTRAKAEDVVLIAGKGHEAYQEVLGIKRPFSDQAQVRLELNAWSPSAHRCHRESA